VWKHWKYTPNLWGKVTKKTECKNCGWYKMAIEIEAADVSTLQLLADDRLVERLHLLGNCASEKLEVSISSANWCTDAYK